MKNAMRDYEQEPGVPRDAYHRLTMTWHPDRNDAPAGAAADPADRADRPSTGNRKTRLTAHFV